MNNKISYIIIILLILSTAYAKKDIKIYKTIEFKNLNYVSKYEIIDKVDINFKGKNIIIDMNSLDKVLNEMPIVKSFNLSELNESLIVSIIENQPIFLLGIRDGEKNTLIELDKDFRIISINRAHTLNIPLIIATKEDIRNNMISSRLKSFLSMIQGLRKTNLNVMNDVLEIDYTDVNKTKVLLKGRRTVFVFRPDNEAFAKLNYAAGYFDRIKYYPHTFTILDNFGIIE